MMMDTLLSYMIMVHNYASSIGIFHMVPPILINMDDTALGFEFVFVYSVRVE